MRIRFVTKAQLRVLQASKAEKHLMPDGPIPLFGSLPSAVSRQWGTTNNDKGAGGTSFAYPIACTPLSATASCTSMSVDPSDAAVTMLSNNSCNIDVKQASYTSAYRVIIIGQS